MMELFYESSNLQMASIMIFFQVSHQFLWMLQFTDGLHYNFLSGPASVFKFRFIFVLLTFKRFLLSRNFLLKFCFLWVMVNMRSKTVRDNSKTYRCNIQKLPGSRTLTRRNKHPESNKWKNAKYSQFWI